MPMLHTADGSLVSDANPLPVAGAIHRPGTWTVTGDSGANAALTVTKAAGAAGVRHYVTAFEVVLRAAAAAADVRIELRDGATVKWDTYLGNAAPRGERVAMVFPTPIEMTAATAVNLMVAAAGALAITTASLTGYSV